MSVMVSAEALMDTYNIYMDELPTGEPGSEDDGNPESNAVIAGLDLVDLINLRDSIQQEIDNYALTALESQAMEEASVEGIG
jgi:hypothetical protein